MVYKKYIKRGGKTFGPYYYKSYRDKNGNVKTKFISGPYKKDKVFKKVSEKRFLLLFLSFFFLVFLFVLVGFYSYGNRNITGMAVYGSKDIQESYIVGDKLNGSLILNIEEGDLIQKDVLISLSLSKGEDVLIENQISFNDFLDIEPVKIINEKEVCENISFEKIIENCSNQLNKYNEIVEVCVNESVIVEQESCNIKNISDFYFNQTGVYEKSIEELIDYYFQESGNYTFYFIVEDLEINNDKLIVVEDDDLNSFSETQEIFGVTGRGVMGVQGGGLMGVYFSGSGSGTLADPWIITNCTQLQEMNESLGGNYTLGNDINCNETSWWNAGAGFQPVGDDTNKFTGNFDGNNYTIGNLTINRTGTDYVGLFGNFNSGSIWRSLITDVGLVDVNISGKDWVGTLVGASGDNISNCFATGSVNGNANVGGLIGWHTGGLVISSYSNVNVSGSGVRVGGFIGDLYDSGLVYDSYSLGDVSSSDNSVGGFIGGLSGNGFTNCYAIGNVVGIQEVGGFIGSYTPLFGASSNNSFSTGNVSGSSRVGGFFGNQNLNEVKNCYWNNHSGNPNVSAGLNSAAGCTAINDNEAYFYDVDEPPMANWSYPPWSNTNDDTAYPVLDWEVSGGGDSTPPTINITYPLNISYSINVFVINYTYFDAGGAGYCWYSNDSGVNNYSIVNAGVNWTGVISKIGNNNWTVYCNDSSGNEASYIALFNKFVFNITNCDELQAMQYNLSGNFTLGNDINCNETSWWNAGAGFQPVGDLTNKFTGTFDGANYTIGNLTINRPSTDYVGLFGVISKGNISNVGLKEINIKGRNYTGGFVGYIEGTIKRSYSTGIINGSDRVGGLVGQGINDVLIRNSYSKVNVNGSNHVGGILGHTHSSGSVNKTYAIGNIKGNSNVGGLVGYFNTDVTIKMDSSFATGNVTGTSNVGGLVGYSAGSIYNCYYNNHTGNPNVSVGSDVGWPNECTAIADNEAYFYDVDQEPLASWSYPPWSNTNDDTAYPVLDWEVSGGGGDTTPPYFDEIPTNQTINYNTATYYNINATDETTFDCFEVNDTSNFKINCSGALENNTRLGVDIYYINITINDSSNNINSSIFWVNVTQIASSINLSLNNTSSNISIENGTIIDLNCSTITGDPDAYLELWDNGTLINNGTSPIGNSTNFTTIGDLNITCIYENTQNYTTANLTYWVNVTKPPDTTPPSVNITYPINLSYNTNVFEINYTISETTGKCWYSNDSGINNYSIQTPGTNWTGVISKEGSNNWTVYCNDSSGNENLSSVVFSKDTNYPLIDYGTGTVVNHANLSQNWIYVNVSITETNPSNITFLLFNSTGQVNESVFSMVVSNSNNTINFTDLIEGNYTYNVTIIDDLNNKNTTLTRRITLDRTAPVISFSCDSTNVNVGEIITCSCSAIDNIDSNLDVSYIVNPSTSSTGTFTTTCTVIDDSGNSGSSNINYVVNSWGGWGGGSSGGGGLKESEKDFDCNFYYWFDTNSESCEYKQFCGLYMYYGLRTFESLEECEDEFDLGGGDNGDDDESSEGDLDEDIIKPGKKDVLPVWSCGEWSECRAVYNFNSLISSNVFFKGEQTRLCIDEEDNYFNKIEKKECDAGKPVIIEEDSKCVQKLQKSLNVYELKENSNPVLVSRLNFAFQFRPVLNIDFSADENDYCDYCYDGVKNYNEDEIDCVYEGDSCPVCGLKENSKDYSCNSYYWFDSNSDSCEYKKFCGLYMYYGLRTFGSLDECESEFSSGSDDESNNETNGGDGGDDRGGGEDSDDERGDEGGGGGSSSGSSGNYFYKTITELKNDIQNYVEKEKPLDFFVEKEPLRILKIERENKVYVLFLIIGLIFLSLLFLLLMLSKKIRRKIFRRFGNIGKRN